MLSGDAATIAGMGTYVIEVLAGVTVLLVGFIANWLRDEEHRRVLREAVCRHVWEAYAVNEPGDIVVIISPYTEQCRKCGKVR
jgi:hypothetical protein